MKRLGLILALFFLIGSISIVQTEAATRYQVTDLGMGIALDINNNGQVVGQGSGGGFIWDSINGRQNIEESPGFNGNNDSGQVVGDYSIGGPGLLYDSITGIWSEIGLLNGSGTLPFSINNLGQVVGHTYIHEIFIWDSINGTQPIGFEGWCWDINDLSQVVGKKSPVVDFYEAFVWHNVNGIQTISPLGGNGNEAFAINNIGQVVGTSSFSLASTKKHAFLWDETNGIQDLGTLGYRPPDSSEAFDININGEVVGRSYSPSNTDNTTGWNGWVAFMWDETHGMRDLNLLIPPDTGWILGTAFAINNQGQIVGYGGFNGEEHAYLLTPIPPELVSIDIKPGSETNCLNINGHGVIPVAILGSADFDVTNINGDSLLFNGSSVQVRGKKEKTMCHYEDVSRDFTYPEGVPDGHLDLVCQFEDDPSQWVPGQAEATLTGELIDGTPIEGTDTICIVP